MPNTILTPNVIANEALMVLKKQLGDGQPGAPGL